MTADLPAAEGAVVVRAIERMARRIPVMPGEEGPQHAPARHADGLVALASARIEPGGVIPAETAMRLLCHSRVQRSVENGSGDVVRLSTVSRDPRNG